MKKEDEKKEEKKSAARDFVELTHVETRKQKIDQESLSDMLSAKKVYDEHKLSQQSLNSEARAILSSFQKKRMMLDRIWIIVNQSRQVMGLETFPRDKVKEILDFLVKNDYLVHQSVEYDKNINDVYILTEKGEEENI